MNNQITMNEYLETVENFEVEENRNIDEIVKNVTASAQAIAMYGATLKQHSYEIDKIKKNITKIDEGYRKMQNELNTISLKKYSARNRKFQSDAIARVNYLVGDSSSPERKLFKHRFHHKIYADISYALKIASRNEICMEDYDKPNSQYARAMKLANSWIPADCYIGEVVNEFMKEYNAGFMRSDIKKAFEAYLAKTDNGRINPFSK